MHTHYPFLLKRLSTLFEMKEHTLKCKWFGVYCNFLSVYFSSSCSLILLLFLLSNYNKVMQLIKLIKLNDFVDYIFKRKWNLILTWKRLSWIQITETERQNAIDGIYFCIIYVIFSNVVNHSFAGAKYILIHSIIQCSVFICNIINWMTGNNLLCNKYRICVQKVINFFLQ